MAENIQELVIEDEIFEEARNNFNRVLQRLFRNMIDSGSSDGSITLKIDVGLKRSTYLITIRMLKGKAGKFKNRISITRFLLL